MCEMSYFVQHCVAYNRKGLNAKLSLANGRHPSCGIRILMRARSSVVWFTLTIFSSWRDVVWSMMASSSKYVLQKLVSANTSNP